MLIDTHCHLHFDAFDPDREAVIQRARDFGVSVLVNVGTDPVTNEASYQLAQTHDFIFHTAGLHPHHSHEVPDGEFETFERFVAEKKPFAIGEIGLDYFKSEASPEVQKKTFTRMLKMAVDHDLPVIVHSRSAFRDTMDFLKREGGGKLRGVMHCFSYGTEELKELLDTGFSASFTCNVTFKNGGPLLEVAKVVPLDRLLLETDAPYLAPQIYRGKRNEPACVKHLADFLSEHRGLTTEVLAAATSRNAVGLFKLPVSLPRGKK